MPTAEEIQQVFDQYTAAWWKHDLDGLMALFASDAVLHDPVDGPVYGNVGAIREYFGGAIHAVRACRLASPVYISGDCRHAAASIYSEWDMGDGLKAFEAMDVMVLDDHGLISTMTSYYGPSNARDVSH